MPLSILFIGDGFGCFIRGEHAWEHEDLEKFFTDIRKAVAVKHRKTNELKKGN